MNIETLPQTAPRIDHVRDEDRDLDRPWHVVLLDDQEHTFDYVVVMLMKLFGYSFEKSCAMTEEVDSKKRVIVKTCHLELAEFYQERIHEYGPDPYATVSRGSMQAVLQRAL